MYRAEQPASIRVSASFNTCAAGAGAAAHVAFHTFNDTNGWPSFTRYVDGYAVLDNDPNTWDAVTLCASIPPDTKWILVEVSLQNATSSVPVAVDDVELLLFDAPSCGLLPTQPSTWGSVKALYR